MSTCLLVPTLGYDLSLLDRLVESIDYQITEKVVIVNGIMTDEIVTWHNENLDWVIFSIGENKGCAGAWNYAPVVFQHDNSWLISNDDQEFQPGALKAIYEGIKGKENDYHIIYVNQHEAYDMFVWTRKGVEDFGLFDENFYPIYFEDYEMRIRFLAGNHKKLHLFDERFPVKHGKTKSAGKNYTKIIESCGELNKDYLMRKWGTINPLHPSFKHPFNNPENKIKDWTLESEGRNKREEIIKSFQNPESLSVYL